VIRTDCAGGAGAAGGGGERGGGGGFCDCSGGGGVCAAGVLSAALCVRGAVSGGDGCAAGVGFRGRAGGREFEADQSYFPDAGDIYGAVDDGVGGEAVGGEASDHDQGSDVRAVSEAA